MGLISENQFGSLKNNGNFNRLKPKAKLWFSRHQIRNYIFFPHLTRNLRSQKENDDLVEEEHKINSSSDSSISLLIMDPGIFSQPLLII